MDTALITRTLIESLRFSRLLSLISQKKASWEEDFRVIRPKPASLIPRMSLLCTASASLFSLGNHSSNVMNRSACFRQPLKVLAMAKESSESGNGTAEKLAIAGGLISIPVIGWSLYTLKTTGCGLPPGPGGSIGALEGVSYLIVVGIIGWSLYAKAKTGSGLPNGPFGLLGAVEGLSYLSFLAIVVVFGLQFLDKGYIPGPIPSDQCFG